MGLKQTENSETSLYRYLRGQRTSFSSSFQLLFNVLTPAWDVFSIAHRPVWWRHPPSAWLIWENPLHLEGQFRWYRILG